MNANSRKTRGELVRYLGLGLFLAGSLTLAAGCKHGDKANTDPILGPVRPAAGKNLSGQNTVPDIPASTGTTSTAALAPGATGTMPPVNDLRIGGTTPAQPASRSGVTLSNPQPIRDTGSAASPTPLPVPVATSPIVLTGGPATKVQTVEQGLALLEARGVRGARLDFLPDAKEWRFVCTIPNRDNPKLRRTHETQTRDPLSAVQAVIDQIEKEQK